MKQEEYDEEIKELKSNAKGFVILWAVCAVIMGILAILTDELIIALAMFSSWFFNLVIIIFVLRNRLELRWIKDQISPK